MTESDKIKNILSFLVILFGETDFIDHIMRMSPEYIIEKFERYVLSGRVEHEWGIHPTLRRQVFDKYCKTWMID
jgi:hypothetical protein